MFVEFLKEHPLSALIDRRPACPFPPADDRAAWEGLSTEKREALEALAERIHVSAKAVSKWETGKGFPDISLLEPLAGTLGVSLTELFSGGFSLIQQIPIGDALRIGVEEYICRNIWLNFSDFGEQEDFGNVELGIGGYVSFRFGIHRLSLEARYAMLDFNPSKPRLTVSLSYNYSIPLKRVTAN